MRQHSPEWYEAHRRYITSTDIPIILGLSPYKCEAQLAAEKAGAAEEIDPKRERMFRLGLADEEGIRREEEIEHGIKLRHVDRFIVSRTIPWAATSLDFERVGERCIVEAKSSAARRWDDGLPQDVEAQVRWEMGVAGYPRAHIARRKRWDLECFDLEHDPAVFEGLVTIADDFRRRLAAGGPFAQNADSLRAAYPADNGAEMVADEAVAAAVEKLLAVRQQKRMIEGQEETLESAIKSRMGEFARMRGEGFTVTWKRTKERTETDWKLVSEGLLRQLPETERDALVGLYTTVRPGFRPLRVVPDKEGDE